MNDISFRNVEDDARGKLEEHLKEGDGPDARSRFFAQGLDLPNKPEVGNVLRDIPPGPG